MNNAVTLEATERLTDFLIRSEFDELSELARGRAVAAFADTIGVAIAGGSSQVAQLIVAALADAGQLGGQHQFLGTQLTGSALDAALFNGAAAHALEFDDVNHPGPMHTSCHIVPALLSLGAMQPVSGADMILAYIVGFEVDAKLGRLLNPRHYDRGWHATSTIGTVAAAAAGARLFGLSADIVQHCLSLAASSAAGLRGNIGSMAKPLHAGTAARAAVQAVLLARRGFTGAHGILERPHGFLAAFGDDTEPQLGILSEFGRTWDIESEFGLGLKPYPCCGEATAAVEAALDLAPRASAGTIRRIVVFTNERALRILTYPRPENVEEARFSLQFCVATALVHQRADLAAFSDEALTSNVIRSLVPRIEHRVSEEHRHERDYGALVRIEFDNGDPAQIEVPVAKGWADRWLSQAEQREKFLVCTREYLPEHAGRDLHDVLMSLDKVRDFAEVTSRLKQQLAAGAPLRPRPVQQWPGWPGRREKSGRHRRHRPMADLTADVVIVGFGAAGGMAAIAAHDAGAEVVVLEKMPTPGGSTQEAGGTLRPPADARLAARHYAALSEKTTPSAVMEVFAEHEATLPELVASLGGILADFSLPDAPFPSRREGTAYPAVEGAEGLGERVRVRGTEGQGGGHALFELLADNVRKRGIRVLCDAPANRLRRTASGQVDAVVAGTGTDDFLCEARQGVILTCGGFQHNAQMKRDFLGAEIGALSPPGRATGDGIRMATAVGADLWHMNAVSCTFGYIFSGESAAFYAQMPANGFFIVNQGGRRYCDEFAMENHTVFSVQSVRNAYNGELDRLPSYIIFDEKTRQAGPVFNRKVGYNRHFSWSPDNSAEVERGWIETAGTIEELARKLGLPPGEVGSTLTSFNKAAENGDDLLGRRPHMITALEAPFYGIPLWPCLLNTQGGPRRSVGSEVLDPFGVPIPGLYSAGELGSIWGPRYPGSGNVAEALVFGQIAGRNAVTRRGAGS